MSQWTDDDELMSDLGAALADEAAVAPHRREAARAAFAWRTIDHELMTLTHDSSQLAAVRGRLRESPFASRHRGSRDS